jgi:hypothetical protein
MRRSSMMGMLLFVAVVAAPTYLMAETTTDKVAHKALTAETKVALKDELSYDSIGRGRSRVPTTRSRAQVMVMQQALKDKGFDPGPIDGTVGPKTNAALRSYQKGENARLAGRMNPVAALLILGILFGERQVPP